LKNDLDQASKNGLDLASKVIAALAALLGTAGYVLVLGAAILWLRLQKVDLPTEVPVSLASRQELIAIGARAVAVWVLLVTVLGGLAAWIVSGDPQRRRFDRNEAGLALGVTISALLALDSAVPWVVLVPGLVAFYTTFKAVQAWPSLDAVTAVVLPIGAGLVLAFALSFLVQDDGVATLIGATFIFGVLVLVAPSLQRWRAQQEINQKALVQLEVQQHTSGDDLSEHDPLATALKQQGRGPSRSGIVVWIQRVAVVSVALLVLGVIAVASQIERDEDFHRALVSLTNGDCIKGTYIARGSEQIVLAQPNLKGDDKVPRITAIPTKEVLEVQVYGKSIEGAELTRDAECANSPDLVRPKPEESGEAEPGTPARGSRP
jgi:hypothetical protein